MVDEKGLSAKWHIDSAGLGSWHTGLGPDERSVKCLKKNGIKTDHKARQVTKDDFRKFDIIFGMDEDNMDGLNSLKPKDSTAELKRLGEYDPEKVLVIQDPYYGEYEDFETVFAQCKRCCSAYLEQS